MQGYGQDMHDMYGMQEETLDSQVLQGASMGDSMTIWPQCEPGFRNGLYAEEFLKTVGSILRNTY